MKRLVLSVMALGLAVSLQAENNDTNTSATANAQLAKHVEEQLKREETFARTQAFQMGEDYNLSEHQVDPRDLESIPKIEPEYDFNMDDVYD